MQAIACLSLLLFACSSCASPERWTEISVPDEVWQHALAIPGTRYVPVQARCGAKARFGLKAQGIINDAEGTYLIEIADGLDEEETRFLLAHEVAHMALGPAWDALPYPIEEGLADRIAGRACPLLGTANRLRIAHRLRDMTEEGFCLPEGWTAIDAFALEQLPEEQHAAVTTLGYVLSHQLPVEKLYELSVRATSTQLDLVPVEWLFAELPESIGSSAETHQQARSIVTTWAQSVPLYTEETHH